jgi:hypothetical protein
MNDAAQVAGRRSQVAGRRSQVAGRRSQVSGRRSQVAGLRSQSAGLRSQSAGWHSLLAFLPLGFLDSQRENRPRSWVVVHPTATAQGPITTG